MPGHRPARPVARRHRVRARRWCIESKSLKLYLWGFRDRAVFAEAMAAEIAGEIMATAAPHWVKVTLTAPPRRHHHGSHRRSPRVDAAWLAVRRSRRLDVSTWTTSSTHAHGVGRLALLFDRLPAGVQRERPLVAGADELAVEDHALRQLALLVDAACCRRRRTCRRGRARAPGGPADLEHGLARGADVGDGADGASTSTSAHSLTSFTRRPPSTATPGATCRRRGPASSSFWSGSHATRDVAAHVRLARQAGSPRSRARRGAHARARADGHAVLGALQHAHAIGAAVAAGALERDAAVVADGDTEEVHLVAVRERDLAVASCRTGSSAWPRFGRRVRRAPARGWRRRQVLGAT